MTGAWMAYALAVSGVAMAAGLGAERALERLGRPTRWVWLAAMLLGVLVPAGALLRAPLPPAPLPAGAALGVGDVTLLGAAALPESPSALSITPDTALLAGWGALSLLFALALAWSALSLGRTRRGWRWAVVEGSGAWISERTGPAVVGFLRPEIVLPAWVLEWDPALRNLIVTHEREHVRAGDGRLLLAGLLLLCAAPWNLALWWQWRRLRQAVEMDCDRRVLRAEPDVRRYGFLLLEVAERTKRHALPMAAFAESRSSLERRIRMMTNRQARNRAGWALAVALSLTIAPVALLALPAPAPVGVEGVRGAVAGWARAQQPAQAAPLPAPRDTISVGAPYAYRAEELDRRPRLVNPGEIQSLLSRLYPPELRAAKVGGSAVVQFVVAADGTVDSSTVTTVKGTDPRFGEASVVAARRFRFEPGVLRGKNVRVLIQMPVTWQPNDGSPAGGGQGVGMRGDTVPRNPADFSGIGRADAAPRDSTKFQYEVARLDTKPELLNKQEVAGLMNRFYPRALREAGIGGPVMVQFVIQPDGAVDPTTLKVISAADPQLGTASVLVAERFRFRPGTMNGTPRRVLIQMPITWQPQASGAEAKPKGFQELIPPKEPARQGSMADTVPDFRGLPARIDVEAASAPGARTLIGGRVLDREGRPLSGASIAIAALHRGAVTQGDGRFAILVPAGTHVLDVSAPGWAAHLTRSVSVASGQTETVEIRAPSHADALNVPGLFRGATRE